MSLNCKLLPDKGYGRLEPDVAKVASPVLRRGRASNRSSLFGGYKPFKEIIKSLTILSRIGDARSQLAVQASPPLSLPHLHPAQQSPPIYFPAAHRLQEN